MELQNRDVQYSTPSVNGPLTTLDRLTIGTVQIQQIQSPTMVCCCQGDAARTSVSSLNVYGQAAGTADEQARAYKPAYGTRYSRTPRGAPS